MDTSTHGGWTWRHPDADRIAVRSRRVLVVVVSLWVLAVGGIAVSSRGQPAVDIVLSAVTAPTIFGLLLLAAWYFGLHRTSRFVLHVDAAGTLHQRGAGRSWSLPLPGAEQVDVEAYSGTVHTGTSARVRATGIQLTVVSRGEQRRVVLPSPLGGRALTEAERQDLENRLRWHAGLPPG